MSKNIDQVFIANPITTNVSTDLMYFGQSPYGAGNDAAMTFANFSAQFGAPFTPAALTKADDTNITLTLGGTPATALLQSVSITAGWAGLLAVDRGGTGNSTFTAFSVLCAGTTSTGPFQNVASTGSLGDVLTSSGAGVLPSFQPIAGGGFTAVQVQQSAFNFSNDTGTLPDQYVATLSPAALSYTDGLLVSLGNIQNNNTGTVFPTLNVNGLGPVQIANGTGTQPALNDINTASTSFFIYDASNTQFNLLNPGNFNSINVLQSAFLTISDSGSSGNAFLGSNTLYPAFDYAANAPLVILFVPAITNTGASTLAVNGFAALPVTDYAGNPISAGALTAGNFYFLFVNGAGSAWILMTSASAGAGVTPAQVQTNAFNESADSGITNAYVGVYNPVVTANTFGMIFILDQVLNINTGPSTFDPGSGPLPIITPDLNALVGGELKPFNSYIFLFNPSGNNFMLLNSSLGAVTSTQVQTNTFNTANDSGAVNAYIGVYNPVVTAYTPGMTFILNVISAGNTGPATFDAGGGPLAIQTPNRAALVGGELLTSHTYTFVYDSNFNNFILQDSSLIVIPPQIQNQSFIYGGTSVTTSPNVYTLSLTPALTGPSAGQIISFTADSTNTNFQESGGAGVNFATMDVNGLGAVGIVTYGSNGAEFAWANAIVSGKTYYMIFDGNWVLLNPSTVVTSFGMLSQTYNFAVDSGIADAYIVTIADLVLDPINAIIGNTRITVQFTNANTTVPTITINPAGVVTNIVGQGGAALTAGQIATNGIYDLVYNTAFAGFVKIN